MPKYSRAMRTHLILIAWALFIILSSNASASTLFSNGSFENGTTSSWASLGLYTGDASCNSVFENCAGGLVQGECTGLSTGALTNTSYTAAIGTSNYRAGGSWMNGSYFIAFRDSNGNAAHQACERFYNTVNLDFNAGDYNFAVDFNRGLVAFSEKVPLRMIKNDTNNVCTQNTTDALGTFWCNIRSNTDFNLTFAAISTGTGSPAGMAEGAFDNFRYTKQPSAILTAEEEGDPFPIDTNFSLYANLIVDSNSTVIPTATCTTTFAGTSHQMQYVPALQKYEYTYSASSIGDVNYTVGCNSGYFPDQNVSGTVHFMVDLSDPANMVFTDITNVTHTTDPTEVQVNPTDESTGVIFSIENLTGVTLPVPLAVHNSRLDGRQYFVYSANQADYDAGNWVFDDSATYGTTNDTPIQKIWDDINGEYTHSFTVSIAPGITTYYRLDYRSPAEYFQTIRNSSDWAKTLEPTESISTGILDDQYSISIYSNIRSMYIPYIPFITGDDTQAFEFQFTAWADDDAVLNVGRTRNDVDTVTDNITLTNAPHRYSVTIEAVNTNDRILLLSSTVGNAPANVHIVDYAIVPRAYFTRRIELLKLNRDVLDLFLLNNVSKQYLQEGLPFRIETEAYDRQGDLSTLTVSAYLDEFGSDANRAFTQDISFETSAERTLTIDQNVNGVIDLNGNASTAMKDIVVKATITNSDGFTVAVQSVSVKFVQYPYFPGDFSINFYPTEKRRGKNPAGLVTVNTSDSSTIIGYDIRIWDANSGTTRASPAYQTKVFKGTDFSCVGGDCSISFVADDYLFEASGQTWIAVTGILNTEYFSLTNPLIQSLRSINTSQIDFDVAKIHQVNERSNRKYLNSEEIPLVLLLSSEESTNLSKDLDVYITLGNCSDSTPNNGPCVPQTTRFNPTGFAYDDKTSTNFYFFRNLWYLDDQSLLPDGNFISFHAHVQDKSGVMQNIVPVLADKCEVNDANDFLKNAITSIRNAFGCSVPQDNIVSLDHNATQEVAIQIDNSIAPASPTQELFACVNTDTNNIIDRPLDADLYCFTWYQVAEKPIDDFRLRISNENSDLSEEGATKQYVEFNVPYELVALNDVTLLKKELETNQGTTINTVGEFIQAGLGYVARGGLKNLGIENLVNGSNVITNIGADIDLQQAFDPSTVSGFFFYTIKGLPVVNAQDYKYDSRVSSNFDAIDRSHFLNYLAENDVSYRVRPAKLELVVDSFAVKQKIEDSSGALLIDETPSTERINSENADVNGRQPYKYIPSILFFTLQNTMFYDNFNGNDTRSLTMKVTTTINSDFMSGLQGFFSELTSDPYNAIVTAVFKNILFITILIMVLIMGAYVFRMTRK